MRTVVMLTLASIMGFGASDALAQARNRVFVSVNAVAQPAKNPFTDRFDFDVNRETGTTDVDYPGAGGTVVDGSVAIQFWRGLGAGVGVSHFTGDQTGTTSSRVPHPFFFGMPREIAGDVGITRTERAIHTHAVFRFVVHAPFEVTVFAGPSFVRVEQDVVSNVEYDESFPFDTASFRGARTASFSGSAIGINAGVDLAWMFSRHVGVGGLARVARARIDMDFPAGRTKPLDAGGFTAGGGLRIAF
jgi:hypothetical protein